jgi:hypothetical protein
VPSARKARVKPRRAASLLNARLPISHGLPIEAFTFVRLSYSNRYNSALTSGQVGKCTVVKSETERKRDGEGEGEGENNGEKEGDVVAVELECVKPSTTTPTIKPEDPTSKAKALFVGSFKAANDDASIAELSSQIEAALVAKGLTGVTVKSVVCICFLSSVSIYA